MTQEKQDHLKACLTNRFSLFFLIIFYFSVSNYNFSPIFSQFGMPNPFSPHRSNSPHGSGDPKIQCTSSDLTTKPASFFTQELKSGCQRATDLWRTKANPAGVHSELFGRLASRVHCRAMRIYSPCQFYLPNPRERLSQCDAPVGVPSGDLPASQNAHCVTHPVLQAATLLPGQPLGDTVYSV
ncbi:UNVERIFIED_CONTAM: hypothetical protein FKN15_076383 [Acipenser sinensis]